MLTRINETRSIDQEKWDCPENRFVRFRQKVIAYAWAEMETGEFKWWLEGLMYDELEANDEFERIAKMLRGQKKSLHYRAR